MRLDTSLEVVAELQVSHDREVWLAALATQTEETE